MIIVIMIVMIILIRWLMGSTADRLAGRPLSLAGRTGVFGLAAWLPASCMSGYPALWLHGLLAP